MEDLDLGRGETEETRPKVETYWEIVWKPKWPWLPWKVQRERRAMRFITTLPGYRGRVICSGMEILLFATETHALKAQRAIGWREAFRLPGGRLVRAPRIGWLIGRYVHRCELWPKGDGRTGVLAILDPSGGWDAVDPEDRSTPWPPADGVRDTLPLRRFPGSRALWIEWDEEAQRIFLNIDEREAEIEKLKSEIQKEIDLDKMLIGKK